MEETILAFLTVVRVARLNFATMKICLDGNALTSITAILTCAKIAFVGFSTAKKKICP